MRWGGRRECWLSPSWGRKESAKDAKTLPSHPFDFSGGFLRCSHVKVALDFPGITAFRASFTGVILNVVLEGLQPEAVSLSWFGGKADFN